MRPAGSPALTFVPLALVIGKTLKMDMERIIILQTLAANLGSMLTPPGNPQNLFLYAHYAYSAGSFFAVMAVPGLISLIGSSDIHLYIG